MMYTLVIVESPTKANTIRKFLPKSVKIASSMGHIRDLPASASEIPKAYKEKPWAALGIDIDNDFKPIYIIPSSKKKIVSELKTLAKSSNEIILATDEDREGEAISWHLTEILKPQVPVKRMVFHEITQEAIKHAYKNCRSIDMPLVAAQETRRILDRLMGYTLSPLLWKKIAKNLSAGRVQSVAVKFIVEREYEYMKFKVGEYYDINAFISDNINPNTLYKASIVSINNVNVAKNKDFDRHTGQLTQPEKFILLSKKHAEDLTQRLHSESTWHIKNIVNKNATILPPSPYITSTLQQDGSQRLGYSIKKIMMLAQKLYEKGLITYMRTDSFHLAETALKTIHKKIVSLYGEKYLYSKARKYDKKSKNSQEAHEAIRPAGDMIAPEHVDLNEDEKKLYHLIWCRTFASQMVNAVVDRWTIDFIAKSTQEEVLFQSRFSCLIFDGFMKVYPGWQEKFFELPKNKLVLSSEVTCREISSEARKTQPPARYTEATLVKELEKRGIGRPSTYAPTIQTIQDRDYIRKRKRALIPTFTAFAVTQLMKKYFSDFVNSEFTASLETKLDNIAKSEVTPIGCLTSYYHGDKGLKHRVSEGIDSIDPVSARTLELPLNITQEFQACIGRFGAYLRNKNNDTKKNISLPEDLIPGDITQEWLDSYLVNMSSDKKELMTTIDKKTQENITVRQGPYGYYIQVGNGTSTNKPRRVSLPKNINVDDLTEDKIQSYLALPRTLGTHPKDDSDIISGIGRYGPYLRMGKVFYSLPKDHDPLTITLDDAIKIIDEKIDKPKGYVSTIDTTEDYGEVMLCKGRYGYYLKANNTNYRIPKDIQVDKIDITTALEIIKKPKSTKKRKSTK